MVTPACYKDDIPHDNNGKVIITLPEGTLDLPSNTGRFGESPDNKIMISRLENILNGEKKATDTDKRSYTHEIRELERYRVLNVPDGVNSDDQGAAWNNIHTATLEDYKLSGDESLLYTPEAIKAIFQ